MQQIKWFLPTTYSVFHVIIICVIHNAKSPWREINSISLVINPKYKDIIYHVNSTGRRMVILTSALKTIKKLNVSFKHIIKKIS